MIKRYFVVALALIIVFGFCAPATAEGDVSTYSDLYSTEQYPLVDGSTATLPLSYALMSKLTGITLEDAEQSIRHSKTTESFYQLVNGAASLLLVYQPSEDVFEYAKEMNVELEMKPIGRDALVFLINDNNPVESLTHEQILDIYTGKAVSWADVGGENLPIIAYQRVAESGSQVMFLKQVMKDVVPMDAPTELRPMEMGMLIDEISSYKNEANAIGFSVYYYVKNMYMQEGIKLLGVNGVMPTNEAIAGGAYLYGQDFYAVIRKDAAQDSPERFVYDWLDTPEGKALIEQCGYVALSETD